MAKKVTLEAIKALLDENSKMFLDEIKLLKDEVSSLKEELAAVRDLHESATSNSVASAEASGPVHRTFVDVVRKSMQSVINDENCKNDVIITNAPENVEDEKMILDLCKTLDLESKPIGNTRMGRKSNESDRERLLKVTFANSFDARSFRARYDDRRKSGADNDALMKLRMRTGRSKEEQVRYKRLNADAHKLNLDAKNDGLQVSFSVRDNGKIWKYVKAESGRWERATDWTYSPSTPSQENAAAAPAGNRR